MDYKESLVYLRELCKFGFNFGLDRTRELLRRLGNPQNTMEYIHVGGTNGKGSVVSMLMSMLMAGGEKPGMFTSPHLHSYRERFRIGNELISHHEVAELMTEMKPHIEAMIEDGYEQPTEFEVNTAMAFYWFAKKGVKIAVMEVGMGGEIDATNVITNVKAAVLVNVALEHTEYLGDTVEKICLTKSGIIKKDCHFITGCGEQSLVDILNRRCKEEQARDISFLNNDFEGVFEKEEDNCQFFSYKDKNIFWEHLELSLLGRHQVGNAAIAIRTALSLGLNETVIRQGLKSAVWPCRLERVSTHPLIIIDGAHNDHGMAVLTDFIKDHYADRKVTVLIGMLADKEREKAVKLLGPLCDSVVVTRPNNPRAGDYEMIADFFKPYCDNVELIESIPEACKKAKETAEANGEKGMLLITGSLYMVADARGYLLGIESE